LVSFKLFVLVGAAIAFVSIGGIEISRNAISQGKKLKDEIKESTADFKETSKMGGKTNG